VAITVRVASWDRPAIVVVGMPSWAVLDVVELLTHPLYPVVEV
jgi:hypothetical protein